MSCFTFIDLFAGIGGMRIAFEELGGECVFSSEIDPTACEVYEKNFHVNPYFDITEVKPREDIEEFDILVGGFPCQAFSMAGKRKGFDDTRGRLFDYIEKILIEKQPKAFLLENVKGLKSHNKGKTLDNIIGRLRDAGYIVPTPEILNSIDYNVPQNRERIYIVGFRKDLGIKESDFHYPDPLEIPEDQRCTLKTVLLDEVDPRYYLSQRYLDCLIRHKEVQHSKGRGFGYSILDPEKDIGSNTLMTGGMGRERNLVIGKPLKDYSRVGNMRSDINRQNVRRLTPLEFARLQRFPTWFKWKGVADSHMYRLFGNSVSIDVIYYVGLEILKVLTKSGCIEGYKERDPDSKDYIYKSHTVNERSTPRDLSSESSSAIILEITLLKSFLISHSHTTTTVHPISSRALSFSRSRSTFLLNFSSQNSRLCFGMDGLQWGHLCQKHPFRFSRLYLSLTHTD